METQQQARKRRNAVVRRTKKPLLFRSNGRWILHQLGGTKLLTLKASRFAQEQNT